MTEEQLSEEEISRVKAKSFAVIGISSAALVLSLFLQYRGDFAYILLPLLLWLASRRGVSSLSK